MQKNDAEKPKEIDCVTCKKLAGCTVKPKQLRGCLYYVKRSNKDGRC